MAIEERWPEEEVRKLDAWRQEVLNRTAVGDIENEEDDGTGGPGRPAEPRAQEKRR